MEVVVAFATVSLDAEPSGGLWYTQHMTKRVSSLLCVLVAVMSSPDGSWCTTHMTKRVSSLEYFCVVCFVLLRRCRKMLPIDSAAKRAAKKK